MTVDRGQSESLGVLFAVGITVILSATVFLTFGTIGGSLTENPPSAVFEVDLEGSDVTFTHESGAVLDPAELVVVLRQGAEERRVPLSSVTSGEIRSGDTFAVPHGLGDGEVSIRLVHEPTNGLLVNAKRVIEDAFGVTLSVSNPSENTYEFTPSVRGGAAGAPVVTVAAGDIVEDNFNDQDKRDTGSVTVTDNGHGVRLDGNRWVWVPYDYVVTDDTVIEFEYRSSKPNEGEIHGIALQRGKNAQSDRTIKTWGEQNYGTSVDDVDGNAYASGDDWRQYRVTASQVGSFPSTPVERLVFINDDDGKEGNSTPEEGETHVRNISIYEQGADYQYRWAVNGNLVSNEPTLTRSLSSGDTVTLTVVDANGRTTAVTYTVS